MAVGGLIVRSPVDDLDFLGSMAGAYDDDAQRWLAWDQEGPVAETRDWFFNVDDANREHMHEHLDDSAGHRYLEALEYRHLIVVDRDHGRYAGAVQLFEDCQVNAWLAPHFRGRNLGADLFAAAAKMAHQHLAVKELYAVVAEQNLPALSALRLAGFQHAPATTETAELQPGLLALRHRTRFAQTC